MSKLKYHLGKVDYLNKGVKANAVEIDIELRDRVNNRTGETYKEFSVTGSIWNHIHTDIYCGGQCLDTIAKYIKGNEEFDFVYDMWKKYHLNGLHAGTRQQEDALKQAVAEGKLKSYGANNYTESCEYLKSIGLYEVEVNGQPYKYGSGWLHENIPEEDLERIEYFIEHHELMEDKEMDR